MVRRAQKNNKHNNNNSMASQTPAPKLDQTNNMATEMPKQEWFEYTGEGVIPEGMTHVKFAPGVIEVDESTFDDCRESLKAVVLNEGIVMIGDYAFWGCSSLESIKFPSTVVRIGDSAFRGCSNLREVVLNEGIETIGDYAFRCCSSLESITFPSTVISISESAFGDCGNLREVVLNQGIQTIEQDTFHGCSSLDIFQFAEISERFVAIRDHISFESRTKLENDVDDIDGVTVGKHDILIDHEAIRNWGTSRGPLLDILTLISVHELKEATTIIELALWKAMIDEIGADNDDVKREDCRVEFPGPAKEAVLQFYS